MNLEENKELNWRQQEIADAERGAPAPSLSIASTPLG